MVNFTQIIVNNYNYSQVLSKLLEENTTDRAFTDQVIYKVCNILALTSGLSIEYILELQWKSILVINSKNQPRIKNEIEISKFYSFPINLKLHGSLSTLYNTLNQPSIDSKIIDGLSKKKDLNTLLFPLYISIGINNIKGIDEEELSRYKNVKLSQQLFGRRILDTNGYSNETSKFLKSRFNLNTNQELFDFLGYASQREIEYNLYSISLVEGIENRFVYGEAPSFLDDDKHFEVRIEGSKNYYPFQNFQVFYDFLNRISLYKFKMVTQSIINLLLISLTNGISLSVLVKLKWSDIINNNNEESVLTFKRQIVLGKSVIILDKQIVIKLTQFFQDTMTLYGNERYKEKKRTELSYTQLPNLDLPIFITNKKTPLTQPSLHREVRKALHQIGFKHADKFTTQSTLIMYGRRVVDLKGQHKPTIRLLKKHFNYRSTDQLFQFLYINEYKGNQGKELGELKSPFEHILYDI